jgi:hypothetical protein
LDAFDGDRTRQAKSWTDLMITNFVGHQLYSTNLGDLLGVPNFGSAADASGWEWASLYVAHDREGDIDIFIGLSMDYYGSSKNDGNWNELAEVIE